MLLPVSSALAGVSGLGIGVHGGLVSGYDNPILEESFLSDFPGFELTNDMYDIGAHLNIGTFRVIEFDVNLDYAWKKQEVASGIDLTFSDFSISGSVRKSLPLGVLKPYAGAGLGLHVIAYSLDVGGQVVGVVLPDNESKSGFLFKAGLELNIPVFPLTPYGEYRYNIIQTTGKSTKYSSIIFGVTLDLP
jgi:opacity protein-like surface antigen